MRSTGAAIVGIGHTEYSKHSGRSELQLACEAIQAAVRDAGIKPADVDGLVTFTMDTSDELHIIRSLGIEGLRWTSRTTHGGNGAAATVQHAAAAVVAGMADTVVIYRAFNERSGVRYGQPLPATSGVPDQNLHLPFGLDTPAKMAALQFQRYMHVYGVTNEDFGAYSVIARHYAATNPDAWYFERPITIDDHQASRWIVEPVLRLLDCCQESDGGTAMVVTTEARAADLQQRSIPVLAATQGHVLDGTLLANYYGNDVTAFAEAHSAARQLWKTTGLSSADIDVALLYEHFSPLVFLQLEAYGFCGRGEARDYIADGNIDLDGACPLNTHGGLLGEAYIHGMNSILEGVRQLRGTAVNQVARAELALCGTGRSAMLLGWA